MSTGQTTTLATDTHTDWRQHIHHRIFQLLNQNDMVTRVDCSACPHSGVGKVQIWSITVVLVLSHQSSAVDQHRLPISPHLEGGCSGSKGLGLACAALCWASMIPKMFSPSVCARWHISMRRNSLNNIQGTCESCDTRRVDNFWRTDEPTSQESVRLVYWVLRRTIATIQIQIQIRPWKRVATLTSTARTKGLTRSKIPLISRPPSTEPQSKAAQRTCHPRNNADKNAAASSPNQTSTQHARILKVQNNPHWMTGREAMW